MTTDVYEPVTAVYEDDLLRELQASPPTLLSDAIARGHTASWDQARILRNGSLGLMVMIPMWDGRDVYMLHVPCTHTPAPTDWRWLFRGGGE